MANVPPDVGTSADATQATPINRRSASFAVTAGSSPETKRATRRQVLGDLGTTPHITHIQLVAEVQRMNAQANLDARFFTEASDWIEQHADCLEVP